MPAYLESEDPFGQILLDYWHGCELRGDFILENDRGERVPAMPPEWFFNTPEEWYRWERETLATVSGPVLDLGCGAGRASLFLQELGLDVTAVDASPGAVAVCNARGITDVRLRDLREPPGDKEWGAILMLCGNLGLAGGWDESRQLLKILAEASRADAVLVADTVDPTAVERFCDDRVEVVDRGLRRNHCVGPAATSAHAPTPVRTFINRLRRSASQ